MTYISWADVTDDILQKTILESQGGYLAERILKKALERILNFPLERILKNPLDRILKKVLARILKNPLEEKSSGHFEFFFMSSRGFFKIPSGVSKMATCVRPTHHSANGWSNVVLG